MLQKLILSEELILLQEKEQDYKHLKIVILYLDISLKQLLLLFIVKIQPLYLKCKLFAIKSEPLVLLMLLSAQLFKMQ